MTDQPQIIDVDIFSMTEGIICHQVNCQGKMGRGIALDIKKKFPIVFNKYKLQCAHGHLKIGMVYIVQVAEKLFIGNLAGQDRYGLDKRYTDYDAVRTCLQKIKKWSVDRKLAVYIPYKMGCNNAGGDWDVVYDIIKDEIPEAIICKKPNESDRRSR